MLCVCVFSRAPAKYTGELIGVEYLLSQADLSLPKREEMDGEIERGFLDEPVDLELDEGIEMNDDPTLALLEIEESSDSDNVSVTNSFLNPYFKCSLTIIIFYYTDKLKLI